MRLWRESPDTCVLLDFGGLKGYTTSA